MQKDCLFCKIAGGKTETEFLYQNEQVVVFKDIHPQAPVHLLILPKKHIRSVNDLTDEDRAVLGEMVMTAKKMAKEFDISASGYKVFINVERGGGQLIFHLHMHLIGGWS
jgi:histidine triad (HIT) family protein